MSSIRIRCSFRCSFGFCSESIFSRSRGIYGARANLQLRVKTEIRALKRNHMMRFLATAACATEIKRMAIPRLLFARHKTYPRDRAIALRRAAGSAIPPSNSEHELFFFYIGGHTQTAPLACWFHRGSLLKMERDTFLHMRELRAYEREESRHSKYVHKYMGCSNNSENSEQLELISLYFNVLFFVKFCVFL